jgi:hypothetical protein
MKRPLTSAALVLAALAQGPVLPSQDKVGSEAPELKADAWLNFKEFRGKDLSQLRGSAVLLEYWATW